MAGIFLEENGVYQIDCSQAVWATEKLHESYKETGHCLSDVDFIIETEDKLLLVEYKNANLQDAVKPDAFNPNSDKVINVLIKKYYDSLHYLSLLKKNKPKHYICVLEYPKGDQSTRKMIRNRLQKRLPFALQKRFETGVHLIDKVDVLNIDEWNDHEIYGVFPISSRSF